MTLSLCIGSNSLSIIPLFNAVYKAWPKTVYIDGVETNINTLMTG